MTQSETPRNNAKTQLQMFMESISTIKSQKTRKELYAFIHVMRKHNLLKQYLKYYFKCGKSLGNVERMFNPTVSEIIKNTIDLIKLRYGALTTNDELDFLRFKIDISQDSFYKDSRNAMHILLRQHYAHIDSKNMYWSNNTDWYGMKYRYSTTWC